MGIIYCALSSRNAKCYFVLALCASDPAWTSNEIIWACNFRGHYFFLPPSQAAKQQLCSDNLAVMLTGLGGLPSL